MHCTHIAYGDESFHNRGRYRSIAIVTLEADASATVSQTVRSLLDEYGVKEFKWQKLRQAIDLQLSSRQPRQCAFY
jgi:hypothetical protein